mmetsp:Transcript_2465/g.3040  ORF Transcript_2465/g.3040 Transcript_2465/m.3040 type:complete len:198 (-) Transcript_2465:787-1380(-)
MGCCCAGFTDIDDMKTNLLETSILKQYNIIPEILNTSEETKNEIIIEYSNNINVLIGRELTIKDTSTTPINIKYECDKRSLYTLIMIDPDALSQKCQIFGPIVHYMIINIKGNNINSGEIKATYKGPSPPPNTGLHRYIFFILEQRIKYEYNTFNTMYSRIRFDFRKFIDDYGLKIHAVNFFLAQNQGNKSSQMTLN